MTDTRPHRTSAAGVGGLQLAAVRAVLVPVILLGEQLVDHPADQGAPFFVLLAAFAAWALLLLWLHIVDRRRPTAITPGLERAEPFVDLTAIVALTFTSGGPFSETGMALFVLPLLAAARLRPQVTARWSAASVAAYLLLSILHQTAGESEAAARMISHLAYLAWAGLAATLLSAALARRDAAIGALAAERGELAAQTLQAEQRERRRIADLLHDESVQTLALAQQELGDYHRRGREVSFERARSAIADAMSQLRGEIFELHPYVLDHVGLAEALRALADRRAPRMSSRITVAVEPAAAGVHDELLLVLARELLSNAAKHSSASHVAVVVTDDGEWIELAVRDDGVGFDPTRRGDAVRAGHIGLASSERRVQALGGRLMVESAEGRGTTVRAFLPHASYRAVS